MEMGLMICWVEGVEGYPKMFGVVCTAKTGYGHIQ